MTDPIPVTSTLFERLRAIFRSIWGTVAMTGLEILGVLIVIVILTEVFRYIYLFLVTIA